MADISESAGDLHLGTVVINVQDMRRAVDFWTSALGYVRREREWDAEFMMPVDPSQRRLPFSLQLAGAPPREPARVHLDLYASEQARHVDRLVSLGATRVHEWPYPADADFVVMRDPDGNEFCVISHSGAAFGDPAGVALVAGLPDHGGAGGVRDGDDGAADPAAGPEHQRGVVGFDLGELGDDAPRGDPGDAPSPRPPEARHRPARQ